jgi:hypothetical protein
VEKCWRGKYKRGKILEEKSIREEKHQKDGEVEETVEGKKDGER